MIGDEELFRAAVAIALWESSSYAEFRRLSNPNNVECHTIRPSRVWGIFDGLVEGRDARRTDIPPATTPTTPTPERALEWANEAERLEWWRRGFLDDFITWADTAGVPARVRVLMRWATRVQTKREEPDETPRGWRMVACRPHVEFYFTSPVPKPPLDMSGATPWGTVDMPLCSFAEWMDMGLRDPTIYQWIEGIGKKTAALMAEKWAEYKKG